MSAVKPGAGSDTGRATRSQAPESVVKRCGQCGRESSGRSTNPTEHAGCAHSRRSHTSPRCPLNGPPSGRHPPLGPGRTASLSLHALRLTSKGPSRPSPGSKPPARPPSPSERATGGELRVSPDSLGRKSSLLAVADRNAALTASCVQSACGSILPAT